MALQKQQIQLGRVVRVRDAQDAIEAFRATADLGAAIWHDPQTLNVPTLTDSLEAYVANNIQPKYKHLSKQFLRASADEFLRVQADADVVQPYLDLARKDIQVAVELNTAGVGEPEDFTKTWFLKDDKTSEGPHVDRLHNRKWLHRHIRGAGLRFYMAAANTDGVSIETDQSGNVMQQDMPQLEAAVASGRIQEASLQVGDVVAFGGSFLHKSAQGSRFRTLTAHI